MNSLFIFPFAVSTMSQRSFRYSHADFRRFVFIHIFHSSLARFLSFLFLSLLLLTLFIQKHSLLYHHDPISESIKLNPKQPKSMTISCTMILWRRFVCHVWLFERVNSDPFAIFQSMNCCSLYIINERLWNFQLLDLAGWLEHICILCVEIDFYRFCYSFHTKHK